MGYVLKEEGMNQVICSLSKDYMIFAPKCFQGGGRFSDTDCIRYGEITSVDEIEFDKKSEFSFKEILTPVSQTLFFFTEDSVKEADTDKKGAIVFLRSCDMHAIKRLDDMYLKNGPEDYYYNRIREKIHFVLMGCKSAFDSCFCVDMGTNISTNYDLSISKKDGQYHMDCKWDQVDLIMNEYAKQKQDVTPEYVTETKTHVNIPEDLDRRIINSTMWREYDSRCINCGRCNFVCPTCTCFTMQDIFYTDNGKVGERRRIWASCMVDGYTDVAGGGSYRQKNGDRMRFKGYVELTIRRVGKVTNEVFEKYVGDSLFLRGPYGNGFDVNNYKGKEIVIVAGGTGVSPVRGVISYFSDHVEERISETIITGFKSVNDILFKDDFLKWRNTMNVILTLDAGEETKEHKIGLVTNYIPDLSFENIENAVAIVVGPPAMMRFSVKALIERGLKEEQIWISQERKMCCGLGKCGHCRMGETYICLDGPVFNYTKGKLLKD